MCIRDSGKSIAETLSENIPVNLPFEKSVDETQGEAVCWNYYDDIGFFTLAEEKVFINGFEFNFPAQLYYYPRVNPSSVSENENYSFRLKQNFPNPFNPSTNIEYYLPENQYVKLIVYDKTGEEIVVLLDGYQLEGHYSIKFDIFSLDIKLSSGIYYYSLIYGGKRETKSMVLIK
jgi:hypothetical protein